MKSKIINRVRERQAAWAKAACQWQMIEFQMRLIDEQAKHAQEQYDRLLSEQNTNKGEA